jgi:hypothetical protein
MKKQISIEGKLQEVIDILGDPFKYSDEEDKSILYEDPVPIYEVVEKNNKYYLRSPQTQKGYIRKPAKIGKDWEEVEVEKIDAYPYFITKAGIHYCYDGSDDDLGFMYAKAEIDRIAPEGADAYRMRYDTYERHRLNRNSRNYDVTLIDFYKIKRNQGQGMPDKYNVQEISYALKKLQLGDLEKRMFEILRYQK